MRSQLACLGQVASYIKDNGLKFGLTERSLRILWLVVVIGSMVLRYYLRYVLLRGSLPPMVDSSH